MEAVPGDIPVTAPPVTDAIVDAPLVQEPPPTLSEKVTVEPAQTESAPVRGATPTGGITVRLTGTPAPT